jgi:hypothetical protein
MSDTLAKGTLWLFVSFLGITVGAGLYESRIVVPHWINSSLGESNHWNADAARQDDTGRRFWAFVSTVPLTLLTIVNLIGAWRSTEQMRTWWLAASILALADRLLTFFYFIPTMVRLLSSADSLEAARRAIFWANLNYLRLAIVFAAWMAALRAFSLLYSKQG